MADVEKTKQDPVGQLWEQLGEIHAGMLGVEGSAQHMQPMAPQLDPKAKTIWFFTKKSSDLVRAVGTGNRGQFCIVGKDHDYHACLSGTIKQNTSQEKVDELWSPVTNAWFENGKDDPELALLEMTLYDAAIWASSSSALTFGWEIAKANITDSEPDIGVRTLINFASATG